MADRPASSPLLSPDDLFNHLRSSLGLNLQSVDELLKPRPEVIRQVYIDLLAISYGRPPQVLFRSSLQAIVNVSYPELLEGQVAIPVLYVRLRDLMCRLSFFELQLRDLLAPDFKRTRVILSEIVNFLKFRTDEEIVMGDDGQVVSATAFTEEHDRVREELDKTQQDVGTLQQKQKDLEPVVVPKQQRIDLLSEEKSRLEDTRKDLETEIRRLETELASLEETTKRTSSQSQNLGEKLTVLEQQVTASPTRVTSSLFEMQQQHEKEKEQALALQGRVMFLATKQEAIQKMQGRMREALLVLEPYKLSLLEIKRVKTALLEKNAQLLELDKELKRFELSSSHLGRELKKYEDQKNRSQASSEAKLLLLEKSKEEKHSERLKEQRTLSDLQDKLRQATKDVEELELALAQQDAEFSAHLEAIGEMHEEMVLAVERYGDDTIGLFGRSEREFKALGY